eukprot:sb/3473539/
MRKRLLSLILNNCRFLTALDFAHCDNISISSLYLIRNRSYWHNEQNRGQHTPKLKFELKFHVSGHNSAISWRNCFFLGLLERGHRARSEELKKLEIGANCAALQCKMCNGLDALFPTSLKRSNFAKKWQSYDRKREILTQILTLVCADP